MEPFGSSHLAALATTAAAGAALVLGMRHAPRRRRAARIGLAVTLLAMLAAYFAAAVQDGLDLMDVAPLHLCDAAIFLGIYAAATLRPWAVELLWFWAGAGTSLAMITPELGSDFPHWRFFAYFGLHGAVVVTALALVLGARVTPRPGAPWRALALTNAYAALVAVVDVAFDANFMYLREKPAVSTPLDWFGPWPWYLVGAEGLALILYVLLYLPFARREATLGA